MSRQNGTFRSLSSSSFERWAVSGSILANSRNLQLLSLFSLPICSSNASPSHILFTDPSTGLLCLGSDAPVGGPTKLIRKVWFQGPHSQGDAVAYASGSDLSLGVRVVAAFGAGQEKSIW